MEIVEMEKNNNSRYKGTSQICKKQCHNFSRCYFKYSNTSNNSSNNNDYSKNSQANLSQVQNHDQYDSNVNNFQDMPPNLNPN